MERIWKDMYAEAKKALRPRAISEKIDAGGVAAAIEAGSGKIYTGVCVVEQRGDAASQGVDRRLPNARATGDIATSPGRRPCPADRTATGSASGQSPPRPNSRSAGQKPS